MWIEHWVGIQIEVLLLILLLWGLGFTPPSPPPPPPSPSPSPTLHSLIIAESICYSFITLYSFALPTWVCLRKEIRIPNLIPQTLAVTMYYFFFHSLWFTFTSFFIIAIFLMSYLSCAVEEEIHEGARIAECSAASRKGSRTED